MIQRVSALLRRNAAWLLVAVSGLALVVAWVLASPVGASPDEPAHISYSWGTVTGQTIADERLVRIPARATQIQIPNKLLQYPDPKCYQFLPGTPTAQCSPLPPDNLQAADVNSYMSRYPPLFYGVEGAVLRLGAAANLSGPHVLYAGRLAAAILNWVIVAFGVFLLARRFPWRAVLMVALLGFPAMAWFMAASVNPNGLEAAAAFLLAAGVLSLRVDHTVGVRSLAAIISIPLGTLLLAWTRPLSWEWACLLLALLLVPTSRSDGQSWRLRLPMRTLGAVAGVITALLLAGSIAWFGYALQIRSEHADLDSAGWIGLNPLHRVILLLLHSGTIVSEQVGNFGWTDTPLPTVALLAWVAVAGVAVAAWAVGRSILMPRRAVVAVLGFGYLSALLDEYTYAWGWQGRYLLPLTAAVCVFALPGIADGLERLAALRQLVPGMLVVLMAVDALAVVWFLFRNVYGIRNGPHHLPAAPLPVGAPGWTPPFGQGVVLALVTLALACGVGAVWKLRPMRVNLAARDGAAGVSDTISSSAAEGTRTKHAIDTPA